MALVLLACGENRESTVEPNAFYDLDSVLNAQIRVFSERGYTLRKTVQMDGKEEQLTEEPDSAGWAEEFAIIRDFDLNQPNNVGAYSTEKFEETIKYELSDNIESPVKVFEVEKKNGNLSRISGKYFEDKSIYQHRRVLELNFEDGLLKTYMVRGFQDMILKDTINYVISGEVIIK